MSISESLTLTHFARVALSKYDTHFVSDKIQSINTYSNLYDTLLYESNNGFWKQVTHLEFTNKIYNILSKEPNPNNVNIKNDIVLQKIANIIINLSYKKDFSKILDTNYKLIGFNNGVYDLENKNFRQCNVDDMISMSVGVY